MTITEKGLVLGAGTILAKMTWRDGYPPELALDGAEERIVALLTVAYRQPIEPRVFARIRLASEHWGRGERSLAQIDLALSGLPHLQDEKEASSHLYLAEKLLDAGFAPRDLLEELAIEPAMLDSVKAGFNPAELRVQKGNGLESGRWGDANGVRPTPVATRNQLAGGEYRAGDPDKFFDTLYPQVHALAEKLGIDETWLLGLAAFESGWLDQHNRKLNDPFGVTHGGGPNVAYRSIGDAISYWEGRYGPVVQGATSPEDFARRLQAIGYNVRDPRWVEGLVGTVRSVARRLPNWKSRRARP
jgi:hypothetical protein